MHLSWGPCVCTIDGSCMCSNFAVEMLLPSRSKTLASRHEGMDGPSLPVRTLTDGSLDLGSWAVFSSRAVFSRRNLDFGIP